MQWLLLIIGLVLGILIGSIGMHIFYKQGLSAKQKQLAEDSEKAKAEAERIEAEAQKDAENRKRELLLQAKEEISKARVELEHDVREKRQELARERNKLEQKEDNVEKQLQIAESKRAMYESKLEEAQRNVERTKELEARKEHELENISGLSIAHLLKGDNEVVVFESDSRPGGMIKCDVIEGNLFHRTGGHVFNTKREDVMTWFWSFFDKDNQFTNAVRNSSVFMPDGKEIPYPIENHAYLLDKKTGAAIVRDLVGMAKDDGKEPVNFEEFLQGRFGGTLYNLYFKPYNEKVWRRDLTKVPLSWLEGKLPMPTVEEIIYNNMFHVEEKAFVHSSFFYPRRGGSQFIADTFSKGLDIRYNQRIEKLSKAIEGGISINGEHFDRVVFCGNIKQLPSMLAEV